MSMIEQLANDQSLNDLFADYLTCALYLRQPVNGKGAVSPQVRASVAKRLALITETMLKAARKHDHLRDADCNAVHKAAIQVLQQHPAGADYYLGRLCVR